MRSVGGTEVESTTAHDESSWSLLFRRRNYFVSPKSQLRSIGVGAFVVLALLILLNVAFLALSQASTSALVAEAPQMQGALEARDAQRAIVLAACSLLVYVGFLFIRLIETHRTAGAAFSLSRFADRFAAGAWGENPRVRTSDDLQDLRDSLQSMADSVRANTAADAEAIETTATLLEGSQDAEANNVCSRLFRMADELRSRTEVTGN